MEQGRSTSLRFSDKSNKLIPRDITESLGKLPPQAMDLEESVLGALMLERNAMVEVADYLKSNHFYSDAHKEIFSACMELFKNSEPIDMHTVVTQLRKNGKFELIGGAYVIAELTSRVSSAANIEYHARVIIEMAIKRDLISMASQIHHDAYEDTTDVFELLADVERMMEEVSDGSISNQAERHVKDIALENIKDMENLMAGLPPGILSGFETLDQITHGWQPSDLIIIAARPGMAKTAALAQMLFNIAKRGEPTGMFSLEMPAKQIVNRLAIGQCEIEPDKIRTGNLTDLEFKRYTDAQGAVSAVPMYIDDSAMLNIIELLARVTRMVRKYGIKAIGVDYIQLINGIVGNNRQGINRDTEIGIITRILKGIAKKFNIPVLAISSLSRAVETRGGDKRPQLSDLRESGNIESDADIVVFLYRPEYYKITLDEDGMPTNGMAEFIFAKHRNGALGTAIMKFIGKFTKFMSWGAINDTAFDPSRYKSPVPDDERPSINSFPYKSPLTPDRTDDTPF